MTGSRKNSSILKKEIPIKKRGRPKKVTEPVSELPIPDPLENSPEERKIKYVKSPKINVIEDDDDDYFDDVEDSEDIDNYIQPSKKIKKIKKLKSRKPRKVARQINMEAKPEKSFLGNMNTTDKIMLGAMVVGTLYLLK